MSKLNKFINEAKRQGYGFLPLKEIFDCIEMFVTYYPSDYLDDCGEGIDITAVAGDLEFHWSNLGEMATDCYTFADELAVAFDITYYDN